MVSSGVMKKMPTLEMRESEFVDVVDTNLNGVFRANQIFGRQMIKQKAGSIINIASIGGSAKGSVRKDGGARWGGALLGLGCCKLCDWGNARGRRRPARPRALVAARDSCRSVAVASLFHVGTARSTTFPK
jgi:NAD(P)-dependent dehydrogenase (short-subunit alcohol dehydrogenase family)